MKKLPLILSVISLAAIALLFVFQFTDRDESEETKNAEPGVEMTPSAGIPFVEVDSLIYNFKYYFELRDELLVKQQKAESELTTKGKKYEAGAKDYEDKVRKQLVTRATAAQMEQDLIQQQQELVNLRDQLQYELMEEEQVMNRKVIEYIYDFLEGYAAEYNYQYVLGKSFGGQIMFGDPALDITEDVLLKLNEGYVSTKK